MKYILAFSAVVLGLNEGFTARTIVIIAFALWSIPLTWIRLRFRQLVYRTDDWKILLQPKFGKEIEVLLGLTHTRNRRLVIGYRLYLLGFLVIYLVYRSII